MQKKSQLSMDLHMVGFFGSDAQIATGANLHFIIQSIVIFCRHKLKNTHTQHKS